MWQVFEGFNALLLYIKEMSSETTKNALRTAISIDSNKLYLFTYSDFKGLNIPLPTNNHLESMFGHINNESVANQTFRNFDFFQTHVHLGTLTFEKNQNHKNFLENFDLRDRLIIG